MAGAGTEGARIWGWADEEFAGQPAQMALPAPVPERVIEAQTIAKPKAPPAPKTAPVQPAAAPVQQVRPEAPVTAPPKPKQTFWDESKGLD